MNKRDVEMLKRRRDQLKCPTSREIELVLEKYQATEKRLTEVKDYLVNPKCPIQTFYMYQNQMDDHKTPHPTRAARNPPHAKNTEPQDQQEPIAQATESEE